MKFKVGQTVKLINNKGMAAEVGATAKVTRVSIKRKWLQVEWLTKFNGQMNGSCPGHFFMPITLKGQQLLFNFMIDE